MNSKKSKKNRHEVAALLKEIDNEVMEEQTPVGNRKLNPDDSGSKTKKKKMSKSSPIKNVPETPASNSFEVNSSSPQLSGSSKHKKQHKLDQKSAQLLSVDEEDKGDDCLPSQDSSPKWTDDAMDELLSSMTKYFKLKPDESCSFRVRLKKISWGNFPSKLTPPRTADECLKQLQVMFADLSTIRNLTEMIAQYRKARPQKKKKIFVKQPFARFQAERKEEIKQRGGNFLTTARAMYAELPEEERLNRYVLPYQQELAEKSGMQGKLFRDTSIKTHSALHFYREKHKDLTIKEAKLQYANLSDKKKMKYIRRSYNEFKRLSEEFNEAKKKTTDEIKPPFCHIRKNDWLMLLKSEGMPVMEVKGPKDLFLRDPDNANAENLSYNAFLKHPNKKIYCNEFIRMQEDFKTKFEAWMPTVKDDLLKPPAAAYYKDIMNIKVPKQKETKKPKQNNVSAAKKKTAVVSKIASKARELEDSFVESGMLGNIPGEPKVPPLTIKDCYAHYYKSKHPESTPKDIAIAFKKLEESQKVSLEEAVESSKKNFLEKVKKFVADLSLMERKIYIGQNRVKFVKMFLGNDIFEDDYPCSEYPPFKKPSKKNSLSEPSSAGKTLTLLDMWKPQKNSEVTDDDHQPCTSTPLAAGNSRKLAGKEHQRLMSSNKSPRLASPSKKSKQAINRSNNSGSGSSVKESDSEDTDAGLTPPAQTKVIPSLSRTSSPTLYSDMDTEEDSDEELPTRTENDSASCQRSKLGLSKSTLGLISTSSPRKTSFAMTKNASASSERSKSGLSKSTLGLMSASSPRKTSFTVIKNESASSERSKSGLSKSTLSLMSASSPGKALTTAIKNESAS
ncbi:uncharacterized protein LOC108683344, partial [Hyalella azteca]|uniref:Uncharacterized protein LOC108683344 n=1 Tax=Hyalella azteca TaxID=294128 RepID=A0A8B7PPK3_HYAAZ